MRERDSNTRLMFPYPPDPDRPTNYGGIDLVENYDKVDEIIEAQEFQPLQTVLRELNSPENIYRTYGCDYSASSRYAGYMLHFGLRDPALASYDQTVALFQSFTDQLKHRYPQASEWFEECIVWHVEPLFFHQANELWTIMFEIMIAEADAEPKLAHFTKDLLDYLQATAHNLSEPAV